MAEFLFHTVSSGLVPFHAFVSSIVQEVFQEFSSVAFIEFERGDTEVKGCSSSKDFQFIDMFRPLYRVTFVFRKRVGLSVPWRG